MSNMTKQTLQKLVDDVTASLSEVLEKAEKPEVALPVLEKATPGNEAPAEKVPAGSSTEGVESSPKEESSSPASEAAPSKEEAPSEPAGEPEAKPEGTNDIPEGGSEPTPDGGEGGGDGSVESLQQEYASLPLEELKMHVLAAKAALLMQLAQASGSEDQGMPAEAPPSEAPPMAPTEQAAPPMAPETQEAPPMVKSQDTELVDRISKLEQANENLTKSLKNKDDLLNGFGTALENFNKRISTRKSVASISAIAKPGSELSKSETEIDLSNMSFDQIKSELSTITANGKLSKSDQTAVIKFVAGNDKDVKKISHLLNKKN